jgi:predicted esterase
MSSGNNNNNNRKKAAEPVEKKKLRILMLHGYRQSEAAFRERTGSLRKMLKSQCEFIFCEAPNELPKGHQSISTEPADDAGSGDGSTAAAEKAWWFSSADDSYNALEVTDCDKGFEKSLDHLNEIFKQNQPIDGVLGFSQGACLAAILCSILYQNAKLGNSSAAEWPYSKYDSIRFRFCIIVAGFKSLQTQHARFYSNDAAIIDSVPTLHIYGKTDKVIPFEMSQELTKYFANAKTFEHELGHFVPINSECKRIYVEFLKANEE